MDTTNLFFGIIIASIGIIILMKHRELAGLAVQSQKQMDSTFNIDREYDNVRFTIFPRAAVLFIGTCFCAFGVFAATT